MLTELKLENFRNFSGAGLAFHEKSVIFQGANGQGKTSLLEALFFLANLRSFRTSQTREIRKIGSPSFRLGVSIRRRGTWTSRLELETGAVRSLRIDGLPVSRASEFTGRIKTIAFLPDDPWIINGPSVLRRRFFDMFICMLDREYFTALQQYSSALKSRNFLLKNRNLNRDILFSYDTLLAASGQKIIALRLKYSALLSDAIQVILTEIRPELSDFKIRMRYASETAEQESFMKKLENDFAKDMQKGFTSFGPHLDDFVFLVDEKPLRLYGSRGQCRMTSLCLKLAELEIVKNASSSGVEDTVVLVDDATGDLDEKAKFSFLSKIADAGQIFYAFTELPGEDFFRDSQIFKVENGTASVTGS